MQDFIYLLNILTADVGIYFINSHHINKGSTGFREMFEKC